VFENRVLRIIFGPEGEEIMGGWKKLHNDTIIILIPYQIFLW
jgi:hypothetical protein